MVVTSNPDCPECGNLMAPDGERWRCIVCGERVDEKDAILRDLAARDPYGEDRSGRTYCITCGGSSPTGGREGFEHEERCVWLRARAVAGAANDEVR